MIVILGRKICITVKRSYSDIETFVEYFLARGIGIHEYVKTIT